MSNNLVVLFVQNKLKACERSRDIAEKRLDERSKDVDTLSSQLDISLRTVETLRREQALLKENAESAESVAAQAFIRLQAAQKRVRQCDSCLCAQCRS